MEVIVAVKNFCCSCVWGGKASAVPVLAVADGGTEVGTGSAGVGVEDSEMPSTGCAWAGEVVESVRAVGRRASGDKAIVRTVIVGRDALDLELMVR